MGAIPGLICGLFSIKKFEENQKCMGEILAKQMPYLTECLLTSRREIKVLRPWPTYGCLDREFIFRRILIDGVDQVSKNLKIKVFKTLILPVVI